MDSYLTGRSQSVQTESKFSPSINLGNYGAPQGSLLGGLLFIINENVGQKENLYFLLMMTAILLMIQIQIN